MPGGVVQTGEDPPAPWYPSEILKASFAIVHSFQGRSTPTVTVSYLTSLWVAKVYADMYAPDEEYWCLAPWHLSNAGDRDTIARFARHLVFVSTSWLPVIFHSLLLTFQGYLLEPIFGSVGFLSLLLGVSIGTMAFSFYFQLSTCFFALYPTSLALAVVLHIENPEIPKEKIPEGLRSAYELEPRWHQLGFLLPTLVRPLTRAHLGAFGIGFLFALRRHPEVVSHAYAASRSRGRRRFAFSVAVFSLLYFVLPFRCHALPGPDDLFAPAWWKTAWQQGSLEQELMAGELPFFIFVRLVWALMLYVALSRNSHWGYIFSLVNFLIVMYTTMPKDNELPLFVGFAAVFFNIYTFWGCDYA
jgi:hypothetical protein